MGARNEFQEALKLMDQTRLHEYLLQNRTEGLPFKINVPHSSHMRGSWERMIRTVRNVLDPLLLSSGSQLDDKYFRTLMTEMECIINARPLTTNDLQRTVNAKSAPYS